MILEITQPSRDAQADEFEVPLEEGTAGSESAAKPATCAWIEVLIPRGAPYEFDDLAHPGGMCIKSSVEVGG